MNRIAVVRDSRFLQHLNMQSSHHPERPERMSKTYAALEQATDLTPHLINVPVAPASDELLFAIHDPQHIARMERSCRLAETIGQSVQTDPDTGVIATSLEVARLAAGSTMSLLSTLIASRDCRYGIAFVRPPGHHAERNREMGFCWINNAAVAIHHALTVLGYERVFVVDTDVHDGNGTRRIFEHNPAVCIVDIHRDNQWPWTGSLDDHGIGAGKCYKIPIALPPG